MVYGLHLLCIGVLTGRIAAEVFGHGVAVAKLGTALGFSFGIALQRVVILFQFKTVRRAAAER